ncbi:MAG: hypothetical protein CL764_00945 [Chloroflexi bacterium]|nr:hypothetical protein [Chloroflexota bacterium]|tara:strand:- start:7114 stop:8247 length:1134 start_codon:yes stop_codon:yes gene_type:complete
MSNILWPEIYKKLGVKPVINARSWVTHLGGSLMPREVLSAMEEASKSFVDIVELHKSAGKIISKICKSESGLVTAGCAAAQVLMSAGCITGTDKKLISELPNPSTHKKEILIFKGQRNHYDKNFEMSGAVLKEFGDESDVSPKDLYQKIDEKTCAVAFAMSPFLSTGLGVLETAKIAHEFNVPLIIDASAVLPPVENLYRFIDQGADLIAFSGGKGIRGPQDTGILAGNKDLVDAAFENMICFDSPKATIGRSMKVSKEGIVGLVTALEMFIDSDQDAIWDSWRQKAQFIVEHVSSRAGLTIKLEENEDRQGPQAVLYFDNMWKGLNSEEIRESLLDNDPSIYVGAGGVSGEINIVVVNLQDGEEKIISDKLNEILN